MDNETIEDDLTLLRFVDLQRKNIAPNRVTLARWMKQNEDPFPQPIKLGPNSIAWKTVDVSDWLKRRD